MLDSTNFPTRTVRLFMTLGSMGLGLALSGPARAQSAADFYKGKELRFIIPSGAGGGYDAYARLLTRHIGDHIPGHPRIVAENMPGASGVRGTNWLYNQAAKDGTVFGSTYNTLLTEPLLGDTATEFDPTKFAWIGSITTQYNACLVWGSSPIKTIQDAMQHEVKVSTTGLSGNSAKTPLMLNQLIGTKFKVIAGYTTTGMRYAVERGEVDGICGLSYDTIAAANPDWLEHKRVRFILQTGSKRAKELPDTPLLIDFVKNPKDRAALQLLNVDEVAGRPIVFPPGTPDYLVKAMRLAFDETMKDPKFIDDAHRMHINPDPLTGEQVAQEIQKAYASPKDVVARAAKLWPPATAPRVAKVR